MLGQRVLTAVVLLAVLAAALASGNPWWFVALLAAGAACACWEWLRLTAPQPPSRALCVGVAAARSEEHTSELQSLMRISYAVFCLKKKTSCTIHHHHTSTDQVHNVRQDHS